MTYSLRDTARSQMKSRLQKIDASERADGSAGTAVSEDYGNKAAGPSSSAKFKRGGAVNDADDTAKRRPDRPHRASGGAVKANKGKTNINIIIAPQSGDKEPMPMPMPMAGPPGPPPAPMGPPPAPPIPPEALAALGGGGGPPGAPPMPMRKRGGAVKMDAGAGSGLGRLEKTTDAKKAK